MERPAPAAERGQPVGARAGQVSASAAVAPHAFMLRGARGDLCALYFAPLPGVKPRGDLLVLPSFAEEMNRCRAMVSLQARALAETGVGTLVLDPYGTGDSAGEFADASWAGWRDDFKRGVEWLDEHGHGCRTLLGVRLGAIMAAELAAECAGLRRLVLWQPVLSGKTFYTQFLRIRIAAEMNLPERVTSTSQLRQMSAAGEAVEVSGYYIGAQLSAELDTLNFDLAEAASRVEVDWFEIQNDADATIGPASLKALAALQSVGTAVHSQSVHGPAFWHVHERELAPDLIEATAARASAWSVEGVPRKRPLEDVVAGGTAREFPTLLRCGNEVLSAFMHRGIAGATRGVVIVVAGGPQYRAGAHRQFVSLARKLAHRGHPVLRFDLRGMGDSSGSYLGFEHSEPDIRAAIDGLMDREPQLREVVLVGECESASGILFYAWQDPRVAGTVLVNPWVRTDEGRAQVIVKQYYLDRLRSGEFWTKVRRGEFDVLGSMKSLVETLRAYVRGRRMFAKASLGQAKEDLSGLPLPVKTATGLSRYPGRVLLLMSGHDYIADEFDQVTAASRAWDGLLDDPRVQRTDIAGADHTFSKKIWKDAASDAVVEWVGS